MRQTIVAVDFDGTLVQFDAKGQANALPGASETMHKLKEDGVHIVIYTCRTGLAARQGSLADEVRYIKNTLQQLNIPFDEIFMGEKLVADFYIDNQGIEFNNDWPIVLKKIKSST